MPAWRRWTCGPAISSPSTPPPPGWWRTDQLFVRLYVPETHLGRLRPGSQVPVSVDSFPGRAFPGVVEYLASEGEYTPRNLQTADERAGQVFAARIGLRDEGLRQLRAGMAAYVSVPK